MSITPLSTHLHDNITWDRVRTALEVGQMAALTRSNKRVNARMDHARQVQAAVRAEYGCNQVHTDMLTVENLKLNKSKRTTVGLTLYHDVWRSLITGELFTLCPWSGACVGLCVINNGKGGLDNTRRAWRWRTDMLACYPDEFFELVAYEVQRAINKHGKIQMRPDVNSNLLWQEFARPFVDGSVFGDDAMFYGYSKDESLLATDGWLTPYYRVAYSWNERSEWWKVDDFLSHGGAVAVVTDRTYHGHYHEPIKQWARQVFTSKPRTIDADKSDEWILKAGVVGDLAFKPASGIIHKRGLESGFVTRRYQSGVDARRRLKVVAA